MVRLTRKEAVAAGMAPIRDVRMPNGDLRFYRKLLDGSGYGFIIRPTGVPGSWQSSHFHRYVRELFVVERGRVLLVCFEEDALDGRIYRVGEIGFINPGVAHNIYLFGGTSAHNLKFGVRRGRGGRVKEDWIPSPELDALTKPLTEKEILAQFG